jgi:O-antigen/teichoic acid export membrane protein
MSASATESTTEDKMFDVEHLKEEIVSRSFRSGTVTLISQALRVCFQLASMVILARILHPCDYGLFGLSFAVIMFGTVFRDLGLPIATLQSSTLNHRQMSALFWVSVLHSIVLVTLTALAAPVLASFYKQPAMPAVLCGCSVSFIFNGLGSMHQALLSRQMNFGKLAKVEITSYCLANFIGIASAFAGAGIWALVLNWASVAAFSALGSWIVCSWRPGPPRLEPGVLSLLKFGVQQTCFNVLGYLNRNLDDLLVGRFCGVAALGVYDRAYQIYMVPTQQICWPLNSVFYASVNPVRSEPERFNRYVQTSMLLGTGLCMPIVAFLFVKIDVLILILLGAQWSGAALLYRALAPAAFMDVFLNVSGTTMISAGQISRLLLCRAVQAAICVVFFLIGVRWGALGVALSLSVCRFITPLPSLIYCARGTMVDWRALTRATFVPFLASICGGFVIYLFDRSIQLNQMLQLLIDVFIFALVYFSIWFALPKTRRALIECLRLVVSLLKRRLRDDSNPVPVI